MPLTGEEVRTKPLLFGITLIVLGILIMGYRRKNKQM
ncbi:LPXTG cell wall anchor domain-containing protein [Heyndrickxia oleronia]|nr:LPXTG cell wall anchor domain-containing protein [Heyndrickxia oleronia]MCM3455199.1 LPXTG cell wall anchor domain-containing protein [Heyndrickxia oleronia]